MFLHRDPTAAEVTAYMAEAVREAIRTGDVGTLKSRKALSVLAWSKSSHNPANRELVGADS